MKIFQVNNGTSGSVVELSLQPGVKYVFNTPALPASAIAAPSPPSTGCGGAKSFACDVCGFKARDSYDVGKHKKSLHTVKNLACTRFAV